MIRREARKRFRRVRRSATFGVLLVSVLGVWAYFGPLPVEVASSSPGTTTLVVLDRNGRPLDPVSARLLRNSARTTARDVGRIPSLAAQASKLAAATIAAEDERFISHPGIDLVAIGRAGLADLRARSMVQGGSTLTQQLVKIRMGRTGRNAGFGAKAREALYAIRLDRKFAKDEILSAYLAEAPFGGRVVGADDAARLYFDTTVSQLTWAQASYLAAIPQRPTRYNPLRDPRAAVARQRWILGRLRSRGVITKRTYEQALREPVVVALRAVSRSPAPHAVEMLRSDPTWTGGAVVSGGLTIMKTTVDLELQKKVQGIARRRRSLLAVNSVSNVAVVVLENSTGAVRAWEGSGGYGDIENGGMINGPLQRRQIGSTIKPFIYGLAFDVGKSPGDFIDDAPFVRPGYVDDFRPGNYDGRFRGLISLRTALASSINVPAVKLLAEIGPQALVDSLVAGGVVLEGGVERHGLSLALGSGEMNLLDLTRSYAAIARGGLPVKATLSESASRSVSEKASGLEADDIDVEVDDLGDQIDSDDANVPHRMMSTGAAFLVTDVLSDNEARAPAFGRNSALRFPFPVAAKTGTSQNFHDNWVIGYTKDFTVGVWVGNFDRTALRDATGITGAGPLFHDVMLAAHDSLTPERGVDRPEPVVAQPETVEDSQACVSAACDAMRAEYRLIRQTSEALEPSESDGSRTRPNGSAAQHRTVNAGFSLTEPRNGATYLIDPSIPLEQQSLRLRATGGTAPYRFRVTTIGSNVSVEPDDEWFPLTPGEFEVCASDSKAQQRCSRIAVR